MSYYIESTKRKLRSSITQLCDTSWMFVKDPERDFMHAAVDAGFDVSFG